MTEPRTHLVPQGTLNFEQPKPQQPEQQTQPKGNKNFLEWFMYSADIITDEFILVATKLVNQLTNKVAFNLDLAVANMRRRALEPDVAPPTLDERNEQDENARGQDLHDELTDMSGFEVQLTPIQKANIYEGLRQFLYSRINDATGDKLPNPDQVLLWGEQPINGFVSLERAVRNNIENAARVGDKQRQQIKADSVTFGASEEIALARANELAQKKSQNMHERLNSVMAEAKSLDCFGDENDWMRIPRNERDMIVQRVLSNIALALDKNNPRSLRTRGTTAFYPDEKQRLRDEIIIHEMAVKRISSWVEEHCIPDEAALARSSAIREAAKKLGIADMTDDLPH